MHVPCILILVQCEMWVHIEFDPTICWGHPANLHVSIRVSEGELKDYNPRFSFSRNNKGISRQPRSWQSCRTT